MDDLKKPGSAIGSAIDGRSMTLLDRYGAIAATSRAMVAAAREQDWSEVGRLEQQCVRQVHQLTAAARAQSLAAGEQVVRVQLLRGILADDAEIRRLAEPWLVELEHLLMPDSRSVPDRR